MAYGNKVASGDMRNAGSLLDIAGIIVVTLVSILIGNHWRKS
jgi:hypothetical protein